MKIPNWILLDSFLVGWLLAGGLAALQRGTEFNRAVAGLMWGVATLLTYLIVRAA